MPELPHPQSRQHLAGGEAGAVGVCCCGQELLAAVGGAKHGADERHEQIHRQRPGGGLAAAALAVAFAPVAAARGAGGQRCRVARRLCDRHRLLEAAVDGKPPRRRRLEREQRQARVLLHDLGVFRADGAWMVLRWHSRRFQEQSARPYCPPFAPGRAGRDQTARGSAASAHPGPPPRRPAPLPPG
jgi:hypothetical protein